MNAFLKLLGALLLMTNLSWAGQNQTSHHFLATNAKQDSLIGTTARLTNTEGVEVLSYEGKKLQCRIIEHQKNVVAIHYSTVAEGIVKIKIVNQATKQSVYIDKVRNRSLAVKKYDLSNLPAGKYLVEVSHENEVATKFIQIQ